MSIMNVMSETVADDNVYVMLWIMNVMSETEAGHQWKNKVQVRNKKNNMHLGSMRHKAYIELYPVDYWFF